MSFEPIPLGPPDSPNPARNAKDPEPSTPITPLSPTFEKRSRLKRLTEGVRTNTFGSPNTPATPGFEKRSLLKRATGTYQPTQEELEADPLERLQKSDTYLKQHIRRLKIISRTVAALLSIAVLVPLAITLHKYLTTKDQYQIVANVSAGGAPTRRTAWALQSSTWPTYMYFSIAVISLIFNIGVLFSYLHDVKTANKVATIGGWFSGTVLIINLIIWTVTTALYKQQSTVVNERGVHNDLWGWTCSPAAKLLQPVFERQINFDTYCDIQGVSFYIGLAQIAAVSLTIVLYVMAVRRERSKKAIRRSMVTREGTGE